MRTHLSSVVLRLHGFLSDCWVPLCLKKQMPADIACVCGPGDTRLSVSRSHQMRWCGNICIMTEGGSLREDVLDKKGGSMSKTGGLTLLAINIEYSKALTIPNTWNAVVEARNKIHPRFWCICAQNAIKSTASYNLIFIKWVILWAGDHFGLSGMWDDPQPVN